MRRGVIMLLAGVVLLAPVAAYGSTEMSVMMGLGEMEWRVMRERVFPPFEQQYGVKIRAIQAEAPDAAKKLVAMHRAKRMEVDRHAGSPLVGSPRQRWRHGGFVSPPRRHP